VTSFGRFLVVANRFKINRTRPAARSPTVFRSRAITRSPDRPIVDERGRLSGSYRLFNPAKPVAALLPVPYRPALAAAHSSRIYRTS
jgi:hypothetical protein